MKVKNQKKAIIIGSGLGGLAVAIRLASRGFAVQVFEKNDYPGGKLSELRLGAYRFDKGPSLLTMPHLIEELGRIGKQPKPFTYTQLNLITRYFYEDGTVVNASGKADEFAQELKEKLGEDPVAVHKHLKRARFYYDTTSGIFLEQSISKWRNFLNLKTLKGILNSPRLALLKSMHKQNQLTFRNPKTVQLFDRYATYNGSNPYRAPALLNQIPHLEMGLGAYLPEEGMHQITRYLYETALLCGVTFHFNSCVESVLTKDNKIEGIMAGGKRHTCEYLISDIDIRPFYKQLLKQHPAPEKILSQEKSSSAYVFYWGVKKEFQELSLHNIFFSKDYEKEFQALFHDDQPADDITIYINITSKYCKADAPEGAENWFVMVNVPHNGSGEAIVYGEKLRQRVVKKINTILGTNIDEWIETEAVLDPVGIEMQTSSFGGSLYGNSSNTSFSAFRRHANYSGNIKGLYFVGGSVHPGGGIPLCLWSGKIVDELISKSA